MFIVIEEYEDGEIVLTKIENRAEAEREFDQLQTAHPEEVFYLTEVIK